MRDLSGPTKRLVTSWRGDAALAALLVAWALAYQTVSGASAGQWRIALAFALVFASSLAVRRRWPVAAAAATCTALLAGRLLGLNPVLNGSLAIFTWTPFLLAAGVRGRARLGRAAGCRPASRQPGLQPVPRNDHNRALAGWPHRHVTPPAHRAAQGAQR